MDISAYNKFDSVITKYLPKTGQGYTVASQIVTAVNRLVYRWYNDGDVYDNSCYLNIDSEDLSDHANWLFKYAPGTQDCLSGIEECRTSDDYSRLLYRLAEICFDPNMLAYCEGQKRVGDIYHCAGPFQCLGNDDEYDDDYEIRLASVRERS